MEVEESVCNTFVRLNREFEQIRRRRIALRNGLDLINKACEEEENQMDCEKIPNKRVCRFVRRRRSPKLIGVKREIDELCSNFCKKARVKEAKELIFPHLRPELQDAIIHIFDGSLEALIINCFFFVVPGITGNVVERTHRWLNNSVSTPEGIARILNHFYPY